MINPVLLEDVQAICAQQGFALYDLEWVKEFDNNTLRASICKIVENVNNQDKNNIKTSVSIQDCSKLNKLISPILALHLEDIEPYHFEVSSTGLECSIKTKTQFELSLSKLIKITTKSKEIFIGKLIAARETEIILELEDIQKNINYDSIIKAKNYVDWDNYKIT